MLVKIGGSWIRACSVTRQPTCPHCHLSAAVIWPFPTTQSPQKLITTGSSPSSELTDSGFSSPLWTPWPYISPWGVPGSVQRTMLIPSKMPQPLYFSVSELLLLTSALTWVLTPNQSLELHTAPDTWYWPLDWFLTLSLALTLGLTPDSDSGLTLSLTLDPDSGSDPGFSSWIPSSCHWCCLPSPRVLTDGEQTVTQFRAVAMVQGSLCPRTKYRVLVPSTEMAQSRYFLSRFYSHMPWRWWWDDLY